MKLIPNRVIGSLKLIISPFRSKKPSSIIIRQTAREKVNLILANVFTGFISATLEGATLASVFFAIEAITNPTQLISGRILHYSLTLFPPDSFVPSLITIIPAKQYFFLFILLAVLLQILQSLANYTNQLTTGYFAALCTAKVTSLIHSQVLSLDFPTSSQFRIGDLADHAQQGPDGISFIIEKICNLILNLFLITAYISILAFASTWFLIVVFIIIGFLALIQSKLMPSITSRARRVTNTQIDFNSQMLQDFQGLRLLHSYGQLENAKSRLNQKMKEYELNLRSRTRFISLSTPLYSLLPIIAIAIIAIASVVILSDRTTAIFPLLVTFVLALQRLNVRITSFAGEINQLADNQARVDRLDSLLSINKDYYVKKGGENFIDLSNSIRFSNISLIYPSAKEYVLTDINFTLNKNQTLAFVGPSGAGKSSIVDLLIGLYQPTEGQILIDGLDLNTFDLESFQRKISVVSQDTFLFNTTILENLTFGSEGSTFDKVMGACDAAYASGFIEKLPNKYNTLIGERGYKLSGGQRQRLSLARAILRNPELLILDEATSSLDSESEKLVQRAIEDYQSNCSVLVIAHRLSTIVKADLIIVLDKGRIVQQGIHNELINCDGMYKKLWTNQILAN